VPPAHLMRVVEGIHGGDIEAAAGRVAGAPEVSRPTAAALCGTWPRTTAPGATACTAARHD